MAASLSHLAVRHDHTLEERIDVGMRRAPDPSDGRARLVRSTARGRREMLAGLDILQWLPSVLEASLGKARGART